MSQNNPSELKVVFLDRETLPDEIRVRPLSFRHALQTFSRSQPDEILERITDADIVVVNKA